MQLKRLLLLICVLAWAPPVWALQATSGGGSGAAGPAGPTGPAGPAPTGTTPQIVGYSAANTVEAETVTGAGDCGTMTFSRTGANAYTLTSACLSSNGNLFTSAAFGATLNLSTPPAIGGTTPAAGTFTTLTSTAGATTSAAFGTALNLSIPPIIGGTTPAAATFTNINQVNAQGVIASGGTLNCNLSLGAICTATVGGGSYTIAKPTNGAVGTEYEIILTSTAAVNGTYASGWVVFDTVNLVDQTPAAFSSGPSAVQKQIVFVYDGTNYRLPTPSVLGATLVRGTQVQTGTNGLSALGPITAGTNNISTTSGIIQSTTGAVGPSAGGVLQSYGGTLPTCACTGGSPTCVIATAGNNTAGQIQMAAGTAVTTCTLTFSASGTFHAAPICGFFDANASITPLNYSVGTVSTSTAVVDFAAATAANINYHCIGH